MGNETATRALVIDGVLTALGWDIKDPARVRLEHRSHGNKVDYVLVSSAGAFLAVVEAKPADSGPKENGSEAGVWIRNGNRRPLRSANKWRPRGSVGDGAAETRRESIFVEVHLTTGEIEEIASTLRKLHRDALEQ